ncbi:hypothetical protein BGZ65_008455, partial [Modicella reniformis]
LLSRPSSRPLSVWISTPVSMSPSQLLSRPISAATRSMARLFVHLSARWLSILMLKSLPKVYAQICIASAITLPATVDVNANLNVDINVEVEEPLVNLKASLEAFISVN